MSFAKIFLGEENSTVSFDDALFDKMFFSGMTRGFFFIKSKIPIPHQDVGSQHAHDNFEFTIPLSHSPKLLIEKNKFTLPRKNIFPSNPGQYHGPAEVARQHRFIALQIAPHELQELSCSLFGKRNTEFQNIPVPLNNHLNNLLDMFIDESHNKQAGHEFILEHLSSLIGATILRTLKSNVSLKEKHFTGAGKKEINKALDYMHSSFNQDFSLTDLADLVGFSKYHFIRAFKKETGKTPYQYYLDLKVEKAIELIKTDKYSITEISFMSGFKDHSHFSRVFLNKTGMAPSRFKEHLQ